MLAVSESSKNIRTGRGEPPVVSMISWVPLGFARER